MLGHAGRIMAGPELAGPMGPANERLCRGDGMCENGATAGCIESMRQTGADMSAKYKETALGGLAVNVPNC